MNTLHKAILTHLRGQTVEEATQFYKLSSVTINQIKNKTRRPTMKMAEAYIEGVGFPQQQNGTQPRSTPESEDQSAAISSTNEVNIREHPFIQSIVAGVNQLVREHNELAHEVKELRAKAQTLLYAGATCTPTPPLNTPMSVQQPPAFTERVPIGTPPPSSVGQPYIEPEVIGGIRPGRNPVTVQQDEGFCVPQQQETSIDLSAPLSNPARGAVPLEGSEAGSVENGTAFNWIRPHAPKNGR